MSLQFSIFIFVLKKITIDILHIGAFLLISNTVFSQNDSTNFLDKNTFRVLAGGFASSSTYDKGINASFNFERVLTNHITINNLATLALYTGWKHNSYEKEGSFNLEASSEIRYYFFLKRKQLQNRNYANMRAFYTGVNFYALSNRIAKLHTDKKLWRIGQAGMHVRLGWQKQFDRFFINLYGGGHFGFVKFKPDPNNDEPFEHVNYGFRLGYIL